MTFEEYWGEDPDPGKITAKHAWDAGQAAERERRKSKERLTDKEIEEIHREFPSRIDLFARAIEQKIWEKAE